MIYFSSLVVFLAVGASALKYKDCGSTAGKVTNVGVSGCEDHDICPVERGTKITIAVSFEALTDSESLRVVSHGVIGGVPIAFPAPQPNGCIESGIECPVTAGETYNYVTELDIKENYPKLKADVKWQLKSKKNEDFFCVQVPAEIV